MMEHLFLAWIEECREELLTRGIRIEVYVPHRGFTEVDNYPKTSRTVYMESSTHLGMVSVWSSGEMEMQTMDINAEEQTHFQYHEDITCLSFARLLEPFFASLL